MQLKSVVKINFYLLLGVLFFSCATGGVVRDSETKLVHQSNVKSFLDRDFTVLAHRGGLYDNSIENTIESFSNGVSAGVDVIETDVHLTKDGKIVVWHDSSLKRVAGVSGRIASMTYEQLEAIELKKSWSEGDIVSSILLFEDALVKFPETRFNVDLKARNNNLVKSFGELLAKYDAFDRVCVGSFFTQNIKLFRKLFPQAVTSFGTSEFLNIHHCYKMGYDLKGKQLVADVLQVPHKLWGTVYVDQGFVDYIKQYGLYIHVWTINNLEQMKYLIGLGVDGIVTDYPSMCFEARASFLAEVK
jgi:glycerophosphoryl diester phosphodiesterase